LEKGYLVFVALILMLAVPLLQMASIVTATQPSFGYGAKGFQSREDLRIARNSKWLEWWVTLVLRQLGIEQG